MVPTALFTGDDGYGYPSAQNIIIVRSNLLSFPSVPNEANLIAKLTNVVSTSGNDRGNDRNGGDKNVRKGLVISGFLLTAALAFGAQGHGHAKPATTPGSAHGNAPSATPAASSDRDKGKDRAADVGKGKKKGLSKHASKHKHHKS